MVHSCCVFNCINFAKSEKHVSFYWFPKVNTRFSTEYQELLNRRRDVWFVALKRENVKKNQLSSLLICGENFTTGKPADFRDLTNPDWIPHVIMGYRKNSVDPKSKVDRYKRTVLREMKKKIQEIDSCSTPQLTTVRVPWIM